MNEDLTRAKAVLAGDDTLGCAAVRGGEASEAGAGEDGTVLTGSGRGVRPLLLWLADGTRLDGFSAADRVVGKAAALLYAKLGAVAVHARTMSEGGLEALRAHGISASYDALVPMILNRDQTGMCPIEQSVRDIPVDADAAGLDAAETAIRAAVAELMRR